MTKKRKRLLVGIPLCLLALCVGALGIYFAANDNGGEADNERIMDMMSAGVYKSPEGKLPYRIYVP